MDNAIDATEYNLACEKLRQIVLPYVRKKLTEKLSSLNVAFYPDCTGDTVVIGFPAISAEKCLEVAQHMVSFRDDKKLEVLYKEVGLSIGKIYRSSRCEDCVWRILASRT